MKKLLLLIALSFVSLVFAQQLQSPDGKFVMNFSIQSGGFPVNSSDIDHPISIQSDQVISV